MKFYGLGLDTLEIIYANEQQNLGKTDSPSRPTVEAYVLNKQNAPELVLAQYRIDPLFSEATVIVDLFVSLCSVTKQMHDIPSHANLNLSPLFCSEQGEHNNITLCGLSECLMTNPTIIYV